MTRDLLILGRDIAQLAKKIGLVQARTSISAGNYFSASFHHVGKSYK